MKVTEHFTLAELTATSQPYKNTPGINEVVNLCALAHHILEPLRLQYGSAIYINSAYRSAQVNKAVGGVGNSQHIYGQAADIRVTSEKQGKQLFNILRTFYYVDQLLYERSKTATWLHVSFSWSPRHIINDNYRV